MTNRFYKFILALSLVGFGLFSLQVAETRALTTSPSSGMYVVDTELDLQLKYTGTQDNIYAVQVRLSADNLAILDFSIADNAWVVGRGECAGELSFTETDVCFSVAQSNAFADQTLLGTLRVKLDKLGTARLVQSSGNGVASTDSFFPSSGNITNLTIEVLVPESSETLAAPTSSPTASPPTIIPIADPTSEPVSLPVIFEVVSPASLPTLLPNSVLTGGSLLNNNASNIQLPNIGQIAIIIVGFALLGMTIYLAISLYKIIRNPQKT